MSILGSGPLGFGGTLDLSTSNIDTVAAGTSYQLFNFTATPSGGFASLTPLGGSYSGITWSGPTGGVWTSTARTGGTYLTFTESTGTLLVEVPEPATLALAGLVSSLVGFLALRRRRVGCGLPNTSPLAFRISLWSPPPLESRHKVLPGMKRCAVLALATGVLMLGLGQTANAELSVKVDLSTTTSPKAGLTNWNPGRTLEGEQ